MTRASLPDDVLSSSVEEAKSNYTAMSIRFRFYSSQLGSVLRKRVALFAFHLRLERHGIRMTTVRLASRELDDYINAALRSQ